MSRFLGKTAAGIKPYVPGEQPRDKRYIKLNTNECPYPPSPMVKKALEGFDYNDLRLYPDPEAKLLLEEMASCYGLSPGQVFAGGGSDEVLGYCFMAFFDRGDKVYFPDITYGFYTVYAGLFGLEASEIPLKEDFTVDISDYFGLDGHIFIANPNAPTGICLTPAEIEEILKHNPDRLVIIDEAYVDFAGGKSCVDIIGKYDNLIVVQTFSKSRSLAGMRLAFAFGAPELMQGLERVKYSFNPYNIDRVSMAVGIAAIRDTAYMKETVAKITATRGLVAEELEALGFTVLPSEANFLFAAAPGMDGFEFYQRLKENGILIRQWSSGRIAPFTRITIGTPEEMDAFLTETKRIIKEK